MHARIDQLLSAHDGELMDAAMRAHIEQCPRCNAEYQRVEEQRAALRALPMLRAPEQWAQIEGAARKSSVMWPPGRWAAALAALVLGVVLAVGYRVRNNDVIADAQVPAAEPSTQITQAQLALLIEQSRELEATLQHLPARRTVERASTAATIDGLERRIQWLDYYLSYAGDEDLEPAQASRLWQERVQLMDTLVKVRYANTYRYY